METCGGRTCLEGEAEDQKQRADCCLHIPKRGFLPNTRKKRMGHRRCKFMVTCNLFICYVANTLLFVDHEYVDDACAEEDALKNGSVHVLVYHISNVI